MRISGKLFNQKGSIVVEASLIVPIIILCILAVLYIAIMLFQQASLQSLADKAVERGVVIWENSTKDIEMGRVSKSDLDEAGLYWRLFDSNKAYKQEVIKKYVDSGDKFSKLDNLALLRSINKDNERVKVEVTDYVIYKKLRVTIEERYGIPIGKFLKNFGLEECFTVKVKSEAVLNEPVEFMRNTDFIIDTGRDLENKFPGLKNMGDKTRGVIEDMKSRIITFFN